MLFIGSLSPLFTGSFIDPRWFAGYLPSFLHQETVQLQLFDEALATTKTKHDGQNGKTYGKVTETYQPPFLDEENAPRFAK